MGDIVKVKIRKLMPFGAFAEIKKGVDGLIHISQISEQRIAKPDEKLKIGQEVNAKIIELDKENKKIELSIKELEGTSNELVSEEDNNKKTVENEVKENSTEENKIVEDKKEIEEKTVIEDKKEVEEKRTVEETTNNEESK